jgi:Protein of unknown function (DUF3455)
MQSVTRWQCRLAVSRTNRITIRINTIGGYLEGACDNIGALHSVAYSADYVFLKK